MSESVKSTSNLPSQVLVAATSPPQEDELSNASSSYPSQCTTRLRGQFPIAEQPMHWDEMSSKLVKFLNGYLMIEISFLNRLSEINLFTPATVVNAFGLDRNTVAKTFAKMGPSYVFPQSMRDPTKNLVMAAMH